MKATAVILVVIIASSACAVRKNYEPHNGDIIFQTSRSSQSLAIQKATHSPYSHMGIVYLNRNRPFVLEAAATVKSTPLNQWIARGVQGKFLVKRLRNADQILTPQALARMKEIGESFRGKSYDLYFDWSDERMYCSELVWKIYKRALGLEIGRVQTIREFDLSDPTVRKIVDERWGGAPPPDEIVISPAAIFQCGLLRNVAAH